MARARRTLGPVGLGMVVVAVLMAGGILSAAAANGIGCGSVVGPGGVHTLSDNIFNCDADPALTIVGPVTFNMNGFRVTCGDSESHGIIIEGENATVSNGFVEDCGDAIDVFGEGHSVTGVVAQFNSNNGWSISSHFSTFTSNRADDNGDEGFLIVGTNNTFMSNHARGNGGDGFDLESDEGEGGGSFNTFHANGSSFNNGSGFEIGSPNNFFRFNVANGNGDDGFGVLGGAGNNVFEVNLAWGNFNDGFQLDGGGNSLHGNLAILNDRDGVDADSSGNSIQFTLAFGNAQLGEGDTDLDDGNECEGNDWDNNFFHTSNDSCIGGFF